MEVGILDKLFGRKKNKEVEKVLKKNMANKEDSYSTSTFSGKVSLNKPIIVETGGEVFAKVYEIGNDDNNFNLVITPNSRHSKLYADTLSSKGLKNSFVHIGLATPEHVTNKMLESLNEGRIHYLIGTIGLITSSFENYPAEIPTPPYLRKPHSKVNLWIIEPELMNYDVLHQALSFGLVTGCAFSGFEKEGTKIKAIDKINHTTHLVMSKEMMNFVPKFKKILSDFQRSKLDVHILNELGILNLLERSKNEED